MFHDQKEPNTKSTSAGCRRLSLLFKINNEWMKRDIFDIQQQSKEERRTDGNENSVFSFIFVFPVQFSHKGVLRVIT